MSKILVVSTERCGSTNFMKTLEVIYNGKFWEHPHFNEFKSKIDKLGFDTFMNKSYNLGDFIGTKVVYKNNDLYINDLIDYHDKVFFLMRKNMFYQAMSLHIAVETEVFHEPTNIQVKPFSIKELRLRVNEIRKMNDTIIKQVDKKDILFYEDIRDKLTGVKVNTDYTQIKNRMQLSEEYSNNREFYTYDTK